MGAMFGSTRTSVGGHTTMGQHLTSHPTVIRLQERGPAPPQMTPRIGDALDGAWLRQLCLDAGADDVGFVALDRPELDDQRDDIVRAFPPTRTLISYVVRM